MLLEIPVLRCIKHKYASINANVGLHSIIIFFFRVVISAAIVNHIGIYVSLLPCEH